MRSYNVTAAMSPLATILRLYLLATYMYVHEQYLMCGVVKSSVHKQTIVACASVMGFVSAMCTLAVYYDNVCAN